MGMKSKLALLIWVAASSLTAAEPCRIEVVDKQNGWPVPLVELRTTHHSRFVTDNAGITTSFLLRYELEL